MWTQYVKTLLAVTLFTAAFSSLAKVQQRPNIVIIMADDLGLGDLSVYNRSFAKRKVFVETPNIDKLAREGMWFTDAHSPTSLCAPSRYSVMSGKANYRTHTPWGVWSTFAESSITQHDATLGRVAQKAGYMTGFVGKWHLGGNFYIKNKKEIYRGPKTGPKTMGIDLTRWIGGNPRELGFDYDYTVPTGVQGPLYLAYENSRWAPLSKDSKLMFIDETKINPEFLSSKGPGMGDSAWDARQLNMLLADKAANFIKEHAGKKPFLLNYWSPAVHLPHTPPETIDGTKIAGSTPSQHLDMNRVLDIEVQRIVSALKASKQYDNTLIIFTSDNGGLSDKKAGKLGHNSAGNYRGAKNSEWEGGHRVPFIAVWPEKIKPGSTSDALIWGADILATVAAMTKVELPADQAQDSWNLLPLLTGKATRERKELFFQSGSKYQLIYREGDWKLIIQTDRKVTMRRVTALYNLKDNPTEDESQNLIHSPKYKKRIAQMAERYWEVRNSKVRTAPQL